MQITLKELNPTTIKLTVSAETKDLKPLKDHTLEHLGAKVKLAGFREGKAPLAIVEKNVDPNVLQAEFLDEAVNSLYQLAIRKQELRPVDNPQVNLKKFVPFSELEFEAEVTVLGEVVLPDYHKVKKTKKVEAVTTKDIDGVIDSIRTRSAEKTAVTRAAKKDDEAIIDFKGTDSKKQPIKGADGTDYPLLLGSNTFIPGFEDNVIGMKAGDTKSFTLTFPKEYGVKALANKKVTFEVTLKNVNELVEPKIDDAFAASVGPFKTVEELKADIKKQLEVEKQTEAQRKLENEIILEIVDNSKLALPEPLVAEQIDRLKDEVRQNLMYRGQTWEEMLEAEATNEEMYIKKQLRPEAERRVKTGLVLAEISVAEKLEVTPEELEVRMQLLRGQYQDAAMQEELTKPSAQREIASRLLTEKTVDRLVELATKK